MFRKRWVRRTLVVLLITLALAVGGLFVDRHSTRRAGEKRLEEIVAHIDATDPRWRYDELDAARGNLPDAENSALLVPRFKAALASPSFEKDPRLDSEFFIHVPPNHVLQDETYDALDAVIANNAQALAVAVSFRDYPKGLRRYKLAPNYLDTLLPEAQDTRLIVRLIDLAAEPHGRNGRGASALAYIQPMMNAARSLDGEPFMISALMRLASDRIAVLRVERTLALSETKNRLVEVQQILQQEADSELFWYSVRGERAAMDTLFVNVDSGVISIDSISKSASGGSSSNGDFLFLLGSWAYKPHLPSDRALHLELMTEVLEARLLPEHEQRAALRRVSMAFKNMKAMDYESLLTRLLTPAFNKIHDASLRVKAHLRCAVAGVAVERFRLARGRWPESLEEIPKDLLAAIPLDPFDGKSLKYVERHDGVTVYSIGLDEQDDGGTIPIGKSTNEPGQDIGFRLYDPDRRGLPAVLRKKGTVGFVIVPDDLKFVDGEMPEYGPEPREVGRR